MNTPVLRETTVQLFADSRGQKTSKVTGDPSGVSQSNNMLTDGSVEGSVNIYTTYIYLVTVTPR